MAKVSGSPPTINTEAVASATGFATGGAVGIVVLATLACTGGAMPCVASGAGATRGCNGWRRQGICGEVGPLSE